MQYGYVSCPQSWVGKYPTHMYVVLRVSRGHYMGHVCSPLYGLWARYIPGAGQGGLFRAKITGKKK